MRFYSQKTSWFFSCSFFFFILSCGKEEIAMDFTTYSIPEYIKKSFIHGNGTSVKYKASDLGNISMDITEGFIRVPTFNTFKPVDYTEKFTWKMAYSTPSLYEYLKVTIDTVNGYNFRYRFKVSFSTDPNDSNYYYFHSPLPKDSIYQTSVHKFHKVYRLGSKDYYNCFELLGGTSNGIALSYKNKLIFNSTNGIIYFEAANGEKITINP
jgi:hypothetical protein